MTKELTPLEAFDELHCVAYGMKAYDSKTIKAEKIIETALKEYEELEKAYKKVIIANLEIGDRNVSSQELINNLNELLNKRDEILQIVKEIFGVDMILFTANQYGLDKEKIDLLKEYFK